jgi:hypothetical protein
MTAADMLSVDPLGVSCASSGTLGSDYLIFFWTGQILLFKNRDMKPSPKQKNILIWIGIALWGVYAFREYLPF